MGACSVQRWLSAMGGSYLGASALLRSLGQPHDTLCLPHAGIPGDKPSLPPCNAGWQVHNAPTCALQVRKLRQHWLAPRNALHSTVFRLTLSNGSTRPCGCSVPLQDELSQEHRSSLGP